MVEFIASFLGGGVKADEISDHFLLVTFSSHKCRKKWTAGGFGEFKVAANGALQQKSI